MRIRLSSLARGTVVGALLLTVLAIVVRRLTPDPLTVRNSVAARYTAINGPFFERGHLPTQVLDAETGQLVALDLPEGEMLQWASFSEWADEQGERQVVGRWSQKTGTRGAAVCEGVGLGRFAFPSGRALDRIVVEALPAGTPCWYPGTAARVLFAAADGRLYQYAFERPDGTTSPSPQEAVRSVEWPNCPPALEISIHDPCWPKDPRLGGRLLAAVSKLGEINGRRAHLPSRLWWLQLTPDGSAIADGAPLAVDGSSQDSRVDPSWEERFPRVACTADGAMTLAYQVRPTGNPSGHLRVARLELNAQTGAPVVKLAQSQELAADCKAVPPVFTPRGDGLYAVHWQQSDHPLVKRYAVEGVLPSRLSVAAGPQRVDRAFSLDHPMAVVRWLLSIGLLRH